MEISTNNPTLPASGTGQEEKIFVKKIDITPMRPKKKDNRCGTFAAIQVLNYYKNIKGDTPINPDDVEITGFFTAPKTIVDFARRHGYEARNISLYDRPEEEAQNLLLSMIDNNIPVLIVIRPDPSKPQFLHYIVINGFEKNNDGKIKNFLALDAWGGQSKLTSQELEKLWNNISIGPVNATHCMIPITTKDKKNLLPPEKHHLFYNLVEAAALAGTGMQVRTNMTENSPGNLSAGLFFKTEVNSKASKNLDWNNTFDIYCGKNLNNPDYDYKFNFQSFMGYKNKSLDWKHENNFGLEGQLNYQPNFNYNFAGPVYGIKGKNGQFEYDVKLKAGFFNGEPGVGAQCGFDYVLNRWRKPMTEREIKFFLELNNFKIFNRDESHYNISAGIKYEY